MRPLIALCMIVRNDSRSLERALESAKDHVDEIDIGVDNRTTDQDTWRVAKKYTNSVWTFGHADVDLSADQWRAGLIHFANTRNIGWARVQSPWIIHIDSDEFLDCQIDLRALAERYMFTRYNSLSVWRTTDTFEFRDPTRFARAHLRWKSPTHNQLPGARPDLPIDVKIVQDMSLRSPEDMQRRIKQRDDGMDLLRPLAEQGDQHAVYHLAKHLSGSDEGAKYAEQYLAMTTPHSEFSDSRATLCILFGQQFQRRQQIIQAEVWAARALFDGPHEDAFLLLAELAETRADGAAAELWEKAADLAPERDRMRSK